MASRRELHHALMCVRARTCECSRAGGSACTCVEVRLCAYVRATLTGEGLFVRVYLAKEEEEEEEGLFKADAVKEAQR